jgi:hypothetical protein
MENPFLDYPGYLLRRAAKSRQFQLTQYLEPLGVGVFEASIIVLIARNPGISQAECGRMLSIKPPNLNPDHPPLYRAQVDRPNPGTRTHSVPEALACR